MIQRRVARLLLTLSLMVAWTTGGWAAACAQPASSASAPRAMAHHGMHAAMHHHPRPAPSRPAPRGEMPECPVMAMNGGSCLGAAQVPAIIAAPAGAPLDAGTHVSLDTIRDRLLPHAHFRPPEA
ncbi:MAG TPA: hypothetical protein VFJ82_15430 [Longimicrobium sp.]|nr:hypothetical protein [Longimicrobium sp.]